MAKIDSVSSEKPSLGFLSYTLMRGDKEIFDKMFSSLPYDKEFHKAWWMSSKYYNKRCFSSRKSWQNIFIYHTQGKWNGYEKNPKFLFHKSIVEKVSQSIDKEYRRQTRVVS